MFQFPGLAPCGLCIHPQVTPSGCPVTPGFPIRRSPDQSLLDSSPRHIAAYHVLHRLSTPRHPPCTLSSLTTLMRGCHAPASVNSHSRLRPASFVRSSTFQRLEFQGMIEHTGSRSEPHARHHLELVVRPHPFDLPGYRHPSSRGITGRRQICVRFFNCQRARTAPSPPPCI